MPDQLASYPLEPLGNTDITDTLKIKLHCALRGVVGSSESCKVYRTLANPNVKHTLHRAHLTTLYRMMDYTLSTTGNRSLYYCVIKGGMRMRDGFM